MNLWLYLLLVNLLTFVMYWLDKRAARRSGASRTPEYVLLLAGLAGGTVAAVLAQQLLRHKNRKRAYQFKFWSLTVVQVVLLIVQPAALHAVFAHVFK